MKKIILTVFFLFAVFSLGNIITSNAESDRYVDVRYNDSDVNAMKEKIAELENEMRVKDLIQHVEFESELIIPDYIAVEYVEFLYNKANELKVPTRIAFRLVYTESRFIDTLTSPKGAYGLMQLMPSTRTTYRELIHSDTLNFDSNQEDIYIGLNYLKDLYDYWRARGNSDKISWKLSLASYNSGKSNVLKYKGIPPYKETQNFVAFISKVHSNPTFFANYLKKYENKAKIGT